MDFAYSPKVQELRERVSAFMEAHVYPAEAVFERQVAEGDRWQPTAIMEELKAKAKAEGLWNLFLPESEYGAGLANHEYAPLAEIMGRSLIGPEPFNCAAPDTGNMEVLVRYGSEEQKRTWLEPLLSGEIRSAFAMTEPGVASSDATNMEARAERQGDDWVINGRKWWTSGACDPRCKILIFMGLTNPDAPRHQQHSMILVPVDTPGVKILRPLPVFGYDDAPHGHAEVLFENVRVPYENVILGEGRGFEIAQGRLGPGRIHHCMRSIGMAERALELMCKYRGKARGCGPFSFRGLRPFFLGVAFQLPRATAVQQGGELAGRPLVAEADPARAEADPPERFSVGVQTFDPERVRHSVRPCPRRWLSVCGSSAGRAGCRPPAGRRLRQARGRRESCRSHRGA